jgi:hypothetical protein
MISLLLYSGGNAGSGGFPLVGVVVVVILVAFFAIYAVIRARGKQR